MTKFYSLTNHGISALRQADGHCRQPLEQRKKTNVTITNSASLIKPTVFKRIKAFAIDYLIILLYVGFLFTATLLASKTFAISLTGLSPLSGQLLGFITLTLPVVLYFTVSEHGRYAATIGKRQVHLQVLSINGSKAGFGQLLVRNCLKFLPWELAHFFVFRLVHFTRQDVQPPGWIFTGLLASQALAFVYLLWLLFAKNNRSLYEWLSRTQVI